MKLLKPLLIAAAALAASQAHAVSSFSYSYTAGVPAGNYGAPDFTNGVSASVQTTSVVNSYLQPAGITGPYLVISSVPIGAQGSATIATGDVTSYSFVWGSPDTYNTVDVYGLNGDFDEYTGFNLQSTYGLMANGSNSETGLFTITAGAGSVIDHLVLKSTGVAFEMAAPVPEPETYALMLAGLGALGVMSRRRKAA